MAKQTIFLQRLLWEKDVQFDFKQLFHSIHCQNIASYGRCQGKKLLLGATTTILIQFLGLDNSNLDLSIRYKRLYYDSQNYFSISAVFLTNGTVFRHNLEELSQAQIIDIANV